MVTLPTIVLAWLAQGQTPIEPLVSLPAHPPQAMTVAFSPDGRWMATSGANKYVTLRDPTTGAIRRVLPGHPGLVHEVAFSPDSRLLASAGVGGIVILWSVESGEKTLALQSLSEEEGTARTVAFSPDGRLLATGASDGTVKIWDITAEKVKFRLIQEELPVTGVRFSPDGKVLATATGDWRRPKLPGHLRLWDTTTGKPLATLEGHAGEIKRIEFSPQGTRLLSAGADRTILVWDIQTRAIVKRFPVSAMPGAAALFPSGHWLALGDLQHGVTVWDVDRGARIGQYSGHSGAVLGIAVHPDGKLLATAALDGTLKLWSAENLAVQQALAP